WRVGAPSEADVLLLAWRRLRALPERTLRAWLGGAAGAQAAFAGRPQAVAVAALFRQHRAFEAYARIPGRHCGLRARPARQRLSLRHGQSGLRGPRAGDRRAGGAARRHSRRQRAAAAALAATRLDARPPHEIYSSERFIALMIGPHFATSLAMNSRRSSGVPPLDCMSNLASSALPFSLTR